MNACVVYDLHYFVAEFGECISFQMNSLEKLNALLDACSELGVETGPRTIDGLGIIPLFSWYHKVVDLLL